MPEWDNTIINDINKKYFYCYDSKLFKYLKTTKNIPYICTGLNENNFRKFWQFERTKDLDQFLHEYSYLINIK